MLDKEKLRARREKEMSESVNVWADFLTPSEDIKKDPKKEDPKGKK